MESRIPVNAPNKVEMETGKRGRDFNGVNWIYDFLSQGQNGLITWTIGQSSSKSQMFD